MSCDYDIHCITCDQGANFEHRDPSGLFSALTHSTAILALHGFITDPNAWPFNNNDTSRLVHFFKKHEGHEVSVRDEYGRLLSKCGQQDDCTECGHRFYCVLPKLHEGAHSWKA